VAPAKKNLLARMRGAASGGLWAHLPPLIVVAVFFAASLILLDETDEQVSFDAGMMAENLLGLLPFFLGGSGTLGLIWLVLAPRRERSVGGALRWFASRNWPEIALLRIPLALSITTTISYLHIAFKVNIPNLAPYSWDGFFAGIDRALFLGQDPWILSHQLMPDVLATILFDMIYMIWFLVMQTAIFSIALLAPRHPLRQTFLLAYGLNWVVAGAVLAILFPAAGPVYMERITGDPTFQPLMELLYGQAETTRIIALEAQEWLWEGYTLSDVEPVGISAFPSLHLSIAATCACLGFAVSRILGWLATALTLGILVASVHLGWHYAIDGIAGIALALVFWWISARVTRWWLGRTEPRAGPARTSEPAATAS
jgi:hypothetical protein